MHGTRGYALAVVCMCADTVERSHIFVKAVALFLHLARFHIKRSSKQLYKPRHGCACQKAMSVISVFIIASNCLLHWLMLSCVHPTEAAVRKPTMSATSSGTTSMMFIPVKRCDSGGGRQSGGLGLGKLFFWCIRNNIASILCVCSGTIRCSFKGAGVIGWHVRRRHASGVVNL